MTVTFYFYPGPASCSYEEVFFNGISHTSYKKCPTLSGCCGNYYNRYCCSVVTPSYVDKHTGAIAGGVAGGSAFLLVVMCSICIYCVNASKTSNKTSPARIIPLGVTGNATAGKNILGAYLK